MAEPVASSVARPGRGPRRHTSTRASTRALTRAPIIPGVATRTAADDRIAGRLADSVAGARHLSDRGTGRPARRAPACRSFEIRGTIQAGSPIGRSACVERPACRPVNEGYLPRRYGAETSRRSIVASATGSPPVSARPSGLRPVIVA